MTITFSGIIDKVKYKKEDGQNEYLICQLKSTDKQSISVKQSDIRILEKNAGVSHKIPIFAIQFLNTGEIWLMSKPEDYTEVAKYINTGKCEKPQGIDVELEELPKPQKKVITSNADAREEFKKEQSENRFEVHLALLYCCGYRSVRGDERYF